MFQKMTVIGNLGGDPTMRYMPDGTAVTNFSVAVSRKWKDNNVDKQQTTWFRVSVFGKQAENANQYLVKGQKVHVEGFLQSDPSTGGPRIYQRQDGTAGASFELRANAITYLGKPQDAVDELFNPSNGVKTDVPVEDEIPF